MKRKRDALWEQQERLAREAAKDVLSIAAASIADKYLHWKATAGKSQDIAPAGIWRLLGGVREDNPAFTESSEVGDSRYVFGDGSSLVTRRERVVLGHGRLCWCINRQHNLDCVGYHSQMETLLTREFSRLKLDCRLVALALDAATVYWGNRRCVFPAELLLRLCKQLGSASTGFVWSEALKFPSALGW
jgi:hypothetical protein